MRRLFSTFTRGIAWRLGAIVAVALAGFLVQVFGNG